MGALSSADLAAWVERSCTAQGLPVKITDAVLVEQVRVLLTGVAGRPAPVRRAQGGGDSCQSEAPDRVDALGAEHAGSGSAWADDGVVQDGADDRGLTGEVQIGPLSA